MPNAKYQRFDRPVFKKSLAGSGRSNANVNVTLQRLADRGELVRSGHGNYYRPAKGAAIAETTRYFRFQPKLFKHNRFWSAAEGQRLAIEEVIAKYVETPVFEDVAVLYKLFGYTRVYRTLVVSYTERYKTGYVRVADTEITLQGSWRKDPAFMQIAAWLHKFEAWRLDSSN